MCADDAIGAYLDIIVNNGKRPYRDIVA